MIFAPRWRKYRDKPPTSPVEIDRNHYIGRKIARAIYNPARYAYDAALDTAHSYDGDIFTGNNFQFLAGATSINTGVTPVSGSETRAMFMVGITPATVLSGGAGIMSIDSGANGLASERYSVLYKSGVLRLEIQSGAANSTLSPTAGLKQHYGISLNGSTLADNRFFLDGDFSNGAGAKAISTLDTNNLVIGSITNRANKQWNSTMELFLFFDDSLDDDEFLQLNQNPYQVLKASRKFWLVGNVEVSGQTIVIGQAIESDLSQTLTINRAYNLGQVAEVDAANNLAPSRIYSMGLSSETDLSQAIIINRVYAIGQSLESDLSQPIAISRSYTVGMVLESDLAQSMTGNAVIQIGQPTESDSAQALAPLVTIIAGQVIESDLSQSIAINKDIQVGITAETDTAFGVSLAGSLQISIGQTNEINTSQSIIIPVNVFVGQSLESDTSRILSVLRAYQVGLATETDLSGLINSEKAYNISQVAETDTSQPIVEFAPAIIGQATESNTALNIVMPQTVTLGMATEADIALAIISGLIQFYEGDRKVFKETIRGYNFEEIIRGFRFEEK